MPFVLHFLQSIHSSGKSALAQAATDLSPTYEREEKKYAAEEKIVAEESSKHLQHQITENEVEEFLKDTAFDEKLKQLKEASETVPEEYRGKSEIVEESFVKTIADRSKEEPIIETTNVISKESFSEELKQESISEQSSSKKDDVPEKDIIQTSVTTKTFDDGSHSIITTKTTERRSFIVDDDDSEAVQEKIVLEKRTDSAVTSPSDPAAKNDMLQMLGEELGKLDDRLEEKFNEKRITDQQDEGNAHFVARWYC